jgi:hypothetical protein
LCGATAFVIMNQCAHWCDNLKAVDCVEIAALLTLLAMTIPPSATHPPPFTQGRHELSVQKKIAAAVMPPRNGTPSVSFADSSLDRGSQDGLCGDWAVGWSAHRLDELIIQTRNRPLSFIIPYVILFSFSL